ncbi:MAG: hypothetical protein ACRENE_13680, partial [Polyangiaceae bacterium]
GAGRASSRTVARVGKILSGREGDTSAAGENWPMRVLAAGALGRLGAAGAGAQAGQLLTDAATTDPYAFVRQAALSALASFDRVAAQGLARRMAASDPEPKVREAAAALAQ